MNNYEVQKIAKATMEYISKTVKSGMSLIDVRKLCEEKMLSLGADSFWYYGIGAFVFSGDETQASVSGRAYTTSDRMIAENDIVTVDLSPQKDNVWGDYARTIIIENGKAVSNINAVQNSQWRDGLLMEEALHRQLICFAQPSTTFEQLYFYINKFIEQNGYKNLDFNGNLGHSIVKDKNDRIYIEKGNTSKLSDVRYFTFEPHIGAENSVYGYKKENIYYFENNHLFEL